MICQFGTRGLEIVEDKKQKLYAAALACVVLLAGLVWFLCAGRGDVSDLRMGADETRNELESAREEQRDQAESLDRAESAADRSQSAIRGSAERADRVQEFERSDAEVIRESQSILEAVRGRGKKKIRVKTRQRNLWIAISGGLLYVWIKK